MSIWTRIAEALASIGESVGAFLQSIVNRDPTPPEKSVAFTIGMIGLGAKMAKADGVVTEDEIRAFKQVFHIPENELAAVARVFNLAKQDVAGYETYARQIAKLFEARAEVLEDVLDGLFHIAKADNAFHPGEHGFLAKVAAIFGFSEADFARIRARHVDVPDDPFLILGLPRDATPDAVRQRYRHLVREHHPDRHIAAGVPEEMIELATRRLQKINEAYDRIREMAA
ncbi:molecular chaperone DjiA [Aestuariivirga litoralis]|uniref:Molecular chaperone DjiA n=1 Tax=Aestuariivirga litoralis TaxID=2650924 RepID=A0A2W2BRH4_9HYPH|nr:DnaJ family molecular chaperone [Aestuariivirga litoralis]PZF76006.1 molecular chaperone DjiA [Aestuariivirga litoralis]